MNSRPETAAAACVAAIDTEAGGKPLKVFGYSSLVHQGLKNIFF